MENQEQKDQNQNSCTKEFPLEQLFTIVDGRMATTMEDVYNILNHLCDDNLMTHHLPVAMKYLKFKNPKWFGEAQQEILNSVADICTNDFEPLIKEIKSKNIIYSIPQLKDICDTSDYEQYMLDNSILLNRK